VVARHYLSFVMGLKDANAMSGRVSSTMPPSAPATSGWGSSAFVVMKDRATIAKNHLTPQILSMREKTSKR
jgi:hypothetical protein